MPSGVSAGRVTSAHRFVIVNADDLGLHEDINRGIELAHTDGIVTSASIVACGEAFGDAALRIRECPNLDVGVHLTLIEERPLCAPKEIPSLVHSDGRFLPSYRHLITRMLRRGLVSEEIRRELRAQVERVIAMGRHPSHLDGHQHVHLLPPVWRITVELAREYGIRWIRVPHFPSVFANSKSLLDPLFRFGLNLLHATRVGVPKIMTPGLHLSGRLGEAELLSIVSGLGPGLSEIVTHPGITTPALASRYRWQYDWSNELRALTAPPIKAALRADGVTLTRFSEC
jgi:chitin disaccharide deacetylase